MSMKTSSPNTKMKVVLTIVIAFSFTIIHHHLLNAKPASVISITKSKEDDSTIRSEDSSSYDVPNIKPHDDPPRYDYNKQQVAGSIHNETSTHITGEESAPSLIESSDLRAIVTGLHHSSTTITAALLYNAPCVIGAAETGFLLAESPARISDALPWFDWHKNSSEYFFYRLTQSDIGDMEKVKDFPEMLDILRHRSFIFNDLKDEPYCQKPYQMIDKTPTYVHPEYFESIVEKTPGVPVIVLKKPYEALRKSFMRRGEESIDRDFYMSTYSNVERVRKMYPNRVLVVDHDQLMNKPELVMKVVFGHVGLVWNPDYLKMTGLKKKYSNFPEALELIDQWAFKKGKHTPELFFEFPFQN